MSPLIEAILAGLTALPSLFDRKPQGRYADATGTMSIEYQKGNRVLVRLPARYVPFTISVWIGTITVRSPLGKPVFKYQPNDDSFTGPDSVKLVKAAA
jgi:hypothetical protein